MIKPHALKKGDKVAIVSLSGGMLGESFCKHDIALGKKRLQEFGLEAVFMPNSLKGIAFLRDNPEARADDLKEAFSDNSIAGIVCAIGGVDTYRLLPFLMDDPVFVENVRKSPKIFTGFSDSTVNHLMFYKLGLMTYYGPNFINDLAELANDMLPYTKDAFLRYFDSSIDAPIKPSSVWYDERTDFSPNSIGTDRNKHDERHGFELLQGNNTFSGKLFGGCLDTFMDIFTGCDNQDAPSYIERYQLMPTAEDWRDIILFLETSENCMPPEKLEAALAEFERRNILGAIRGIIVGKPQNEKYYDEYKAVYKRVLSKYAALPVLYNVNFGHAYPRTVLPYGADVTVNAELQEISVRERIVED